MVIRAKFQKPDNVYFLIVIGFVAFILLTLLHSVTCDETGLPGMGCANLTNTPGQFNFSTGDGVGVGVDDDVSLAMQSNPPPFLAVDDDPEPVARPDYYTLNINTPLYVESSSLLVNDSYTDDGDVSLVIVANVRHGVLQLQRGGRFTYVPDAGYSGLDYFSYRLHDGASTSTAQVQLLVNDPTSDFALEPQDETQATSIAEANELNVPETQIILTDVVATSADVRLQWQTTLVEFAADMLYEVVVERADGTVLVDNLYEADIICEEGTCTIDLGENLATYVVDGLYRWQVRGMSSVGQTQPVTASFEVDLPNPAAPEGFSVDVSTGGPVISVPTDSLASAYRVDIRSVADASGNDPDFAHTAWYVRNELLCLDTHCLISPDINPQNGRYEVYVQAWGPGGLSTGGIQGWAGPVIFEIDLLRAGVALPLTATHTASGSPTFTWEAAPNATWYQLWVGTDAPDYITEHLQWYAARDLGCEGMAVCSVTPPDLMLDNHITYTWFLKAWGPGGMSLGGTDGWVAGDPFTVNAGIVFVPQIAIMERTEDDQLHLEWTHPESTTWYQVRIETVGNASQVVYEQWHHVTTLGCRDDNRCALTLNTLQPGRYTVSLRLYNPAGYGLASTMRVFDFDS